MLFLKYMLLVVGVGMFAIAAAIVSNDAWLAFQYRRKTALGTAAVEPEPIRWRTTVALVCLAWAPILIGMSIVVPSAVSAAHAHHRTQAILASIKTQ